MHIILLSRAVDTLKACAMTNRITLVVSRDSESQKDFNRLSKSLLRATAKGECPATPITKRLITQWVERS